MKGPIHSYYEYGAASSEVEIDVQTGGHRLLKTVTVCNAGKSLNPGIDIGQIEGGFLQGYGWLTRERVHIADNSCGWAKPGIFVSDGEFAVTSLPNRRGTIGGVLSAKGVGEPPMILANSVGFALANAISAARRAKNVPEHLDYEFPLTSDKIRRSCQF
jgi:xanthine dehydrogenase/oxidase